MAIFSSNRAGRESASDRWLHQTSAGPRVVGRVPGSLLEKSGKMLMAKLSVNDWGTTEFHHNGILFLKVV